MFYNESYRDKASDYFVIEQWLNRSDLKLKDEIGDSFIKDIYPKADRGISIKKNWMVMENFTYKT